MQGKTELKNLEEYFNKAESNNIQFQGFCKDCNCHVTVNIDKDPDGKVQIEGGALYFEENDFFLKCNSCFKSDPELHDWRKIETFSRVVGFLTPINQWNAGKQSEWKKRKEYKLPSEKQLKSLNFE